MFPPDATDSEWLERAGREGWVVITKDRRIRYRPGEQRALLTSGVQAFVLTGTKERRADQLAETIVTALPTIVHLAMTEPGPYIKGIGRDGRIRHLFP